MRLLCVLSVCWLFVFAYGCTTSETISAMNEHVSGIALELVKVGAITFDFAKGTAGLLMSVPGLLHTMCNTADVKNLLQEIHDNVTACPQLLSESSGLQLLTIDGVNMTTLFTDFVDIDAFCGCTSPVAAAWVIKARKDHLLHENSEWFYNATADAYAICSNAELRDALFQFGATSDECRNATQKQAHIATDEELNKIHRIVKVAGTGVCNNFSSDIKKCIDETASKSSVHFCLKLVSTLTEDKQACGKRMCITTYIGGHCGNGSADLHIAAVNVEHPGEIADTNDDCATYTDLTCVSYEDLRKVNTAVETVSEYLNHYVNESVDNATVETENIPTVLNMICNETGLRQDMENVETLTSPCRILDDLSTSFGQLNMNGWRIKDTYQKFPSMATFCGFVQPGHGLVHSWNLRKKEATWIHTDPQAHFRTIANIGSICGVEQKEMIKDIASVTEECKQVLEEEAGFSSSSDPTFSELHELVNACNSSIDVKSEWACTTSIATSNDFKTCITEAETQGGEQALCGKYQCVFTEMQGCGVTARNLYIKAVNMKNSDGIRETYEGCDGASGSCFSLLVLIAGCVLSMM